MQVSDRVWGTALQMPTAGYLLIQVPETVFTTSLQITLERRSFNLARKGGRFGGVILRHMVKNIPLEQFPRVSSLPAKKEILNQDSTTSGQGTTARTWGGSCRPTGRHKRCLFRMLTSTIRRASISTATPAIIRSDVQTQMGTFGRSWGTS